MSCPWGFTGLVPEAAATVTQRPGRNRHPVVAARRADPVVDAAPDSPPCGVAARRRARPGRSMMKLGSEPTVLSHRMSRMSRAEPRTFATRTAVIRVWRRATGQRLFGYSRTRPQPAGGQLRLYGRLPAQSLVEARDGATTQYRCSEGHLRSASHLSATSGSACTAAVRELVAGEPAQVRRRETILEHYVSSFMCAPPRPQGRSGTLQR